MLRLQYFGHLMQRAEWLEKTLMLGKTEGRRTRGWQRMRWLDGIIDSMDMNLSKLQDIGKERGDWLGVLQSMGSQRVRCNLVTENNNNHPLQTHPYYSPPALLVSKITLLFLAVPLTTFPWQLSYYLLICGLPLNCCSAGVVFPDCQDSVTSSCSTLPEHFYDDQISVCLPF